MEMTTPPASVPVYGNTTAFSNYAMGWIAATPPPPEVPYLWHNGETLAYTALNSLNPANGLSVAILTNIDIQAPTPLGPLGANLMATFCQNSPPGTC